MSCCPPNRLPALTNPDEYKKQGKEIMLDDMRVYAVGDPSSKKAVVIIHDIFGVFMGRHCAIADQFAGEGYYAIAPDLYKGDFRIQKREDLAKLAGPFLKDWTYDRVVPSMDLVYAHLEKQGITSVGLIGFCWGVWAIYHESQRGAPFKSGVCCHPSLGIENMHGGDWETLAKAVAHPMLMYPCKGDPDYVQPGGAVEKILQGKPFGKQCGVVAFPDQDHGFVSQGDLKNEDTLRDVEKAMAGASAFFKNTL